MILEALEYLTTPCPPWARRFGYLTEAIALRHRARRCAADWSEHQTRTKAAILDACPAPCGHAVILGAGLCGDVPLAELAARCGRVTLVDAIRLRGLNLPRNVDFQIADIHGLAEKLYSGQSLWQRPASPLARYAGADYVVSVNLISQLPILPLRQIGRRGLSSPLFEHGLSGQIMRDHVTDLRALSTRAVLIGDSRRIVRDKSGNVETDENLAVVALLPAPQSSWSWPIVPPGEDRSGRQVETTVGVWTI